MNHLPGSERLEKNSIYSGNKNHKASQAIYLQPHDRGEEYVNRKFNRATNDENLLFICAQSLDLANLDDQERVIQKKSWIVSNQIYILFNNNMFYKEFHVFRLAHMIKKGIQCC